MLHEEQNTKKTFYITFHSIFGYTCKASVKRPLCFPRRGNSVMHFVHGLKFFNQTLTISLKVQKKHFDTPIFNI